MKGKTFKDQKEGKELADFFHERKEGARKVKGGHTNLLRDSLQEDLNEALEDLKEVEDILAED